MVSRTATICLTAVLLTACGAETLPLEAGIQEGVRVVYGTPNSDGGVVGLETGGGDILVAGFGDGVIAPADGTLPTPNLALIRPDGEIAWSRLFPELRYGTALGLVAISPTRFAMLTAGHDESFGERRVDLWEVDADGGLGRRLYRRTAASTFFAATHPLIRTRNGDLVLTGQDDGEAPVSFIVRVDDQGQVQWEHLIAGRVEIGAIVETADREILVVGTEIVDPDVFDQDLFLRSLDASGRAQWTRRLNRGAQQTTVSAIAPSGDDTFLVAGTQAPTGGESAGPIPFVLEIAADGTERRLTTSDDFAENDFTTVGTLTALASGNLALVGWTRPPANLTVAFVRIIAPTGAVIVSRTFGASGRNGFASDVLELRDGRLAVVGSQGPDEPSFGGADTDAVVLLLDRSAGDAN